MIRGTLKAPQNTITGAFTIIISMIREMELTAADITVETLEGDALGHDKDTFGGSGANYHILCYIPDARSGKSRISINRADLDVEPVIVAYDTIRTVTPTFGTPVDRGQSIEIPITFDAPLIHLRKRNFKLTPAARFQLYGTGNAYSLVVSSTVQSVSGLWQRRETKRSPSRDNRNSV